MTDDNGEVRPIKTLADLNARNRDLNPPQPLPRRRRDGSLVDDLFPKPEPLR